MNFVSQERPPVARVAWLSRLLAERFSPDLALSVDDDGFVLKVPGSDVYLHVDMDAAAFDVEDQNLPCTTWQVEGHFTPAIAGPLPAPGASCIPEPLFVATGGGHRIRYDLLSLAYWMLSRREEVGRRDLDVHGRFPATSSHAYKAGYLGRPLVDEWFWILRQAIQRTWPALPLRKLEASMRVSHDVDTPSRYAFNGAVAMLRVMAGDLLHRRDVRGAMHGASIRLRSGKALQSDDPLNTFDWLMDQSDKRGLTSAFYFICGRTDPARDARYDPEDFRIRSLMRRIHSRGHEIGLHPSYNTYENPSVLAGEYQRLRRVCDEEDIRQEAWGGRMHFLRWNTPTTLRAWNDAGLDYDSTMTYADAPGFRCGTCFEFPAFDPVHNEALRLRIRPLVAMECSVAASGYMGLGYGARALEKFVELKNACRAVGGCFTLLWHNSELASQQKKALYCAVLDA